MKKLVTGILALILVISSLCFIGGCQVQSATENKNESVISFPEALTFTSTALASAQESGEQGVTATLLAEIQPADANNKNVTWTVAWKEDAALKDENVSEYLIGEADENNPLRFNLTCLKSFSGSEIIVAVTTEDGAYSAECMVAFQGIATKLIAEIIPNEFCTLKTTPERGEYYSLSAEYKTISFNIFGINAAGTTDCNLDISLIPFVKGEAYFAPNYDSFFTPVFAGQICYDESRIAEGKSPAYVVWENSVEVNKSPLTSRRGLNPALSGQGPFSAYMNGNSLTISVGENYLKSVSGWIDNTSGTKGSGLYKESGPLAASYITRHFELYDELLDFEVSDPDSPYDADYFYGLAEANEELSKSCFYFVRVTDKVSGLSIEIPFYFN